MEIVTRHARQANQLYSYCFPCVILSGYTCLARLPCLVELKRMREL